MFGTTEFGIGERCVLTFSAPPSYVFGMVLCGSLLPKTLCGGMQGSRIFRPTETRLAQQACVQLSSDLLSASRGIANVVSLVRGCPLVRSFIRPTVVHTGITPFPMSCCVHKSTHKHSNGVPRCIGRFCLWPASQRPCATDTSIR